MTLTGAVGVARGVMARGVGLTPSSEMDSGRKQEWIDG